MTFRDVGSGVRSALRSLPAMLLPILLSSPAATAADEEHQPSPAPVRVYTNEDLDRVHPFRDETGAASVPSVSQEPADDARASSARGRRHDEAYWRHEAEKVRVRVRALAEQAEDLRERISEDAAEAQRILRRGRAGASSPSAQARRRTRLASLERRSRQLEEDLAERARREGALPGWLR